MYLIVWIRKGVVKSGLDTDDTLINENVVFYAKPGQLFTLKVDEFAIGYVISFAKEFVELTEISLAGSLHSSFFNRFGAIPTVL